ncbi:MAG: DUF4373 domain-containing protein [Clostridiales bacterium]|nr:DUF4373 domain-containing protein [Clostridiales bacterium]
MDTKLKLIESEFGLQGFAIVVRLWMEIYGQQGYYCEWNTDVALLFAHEVGMGGNVVSEVLNACFRRGIFSKELYEKYHVLTSSGIQKRYAAATVERKCVEWENKYLLISAPKNAVFRPINSINPPINSINLPINPQSKVKESKVKESKNIYSVDVAPEIQSQWEAFINMRNDIKKPLTQRGAELALEKLNKLAPNDFAAQGQILDQSTFNCWRGLFPLLNNKGDDGGDKNDYRNFKPSR